MALFHYKAARADGQLIEGQVEAARREDVARLLQTQGSIPIRIDSGPPGAGGDVARPGAASRQAVGGRIRSGTIDFFTLELATLLRAGLPLGTALGTLSELAEDPTLAELAAAVHQRIRDGAPLSTALEQANPGFDRFYCNMVRAGESSGALDLALERLAQYRASRRELRSSILSSLLYPAILLVMAFVAILVLLAFVVPQFTEMFAEAGRDLPLLTRIIAGAGELVTRYWWLLLLIIGTAGVLLVRDWQTPAGRLRWDGIALRAPLTGPLLRKLNTARFARTLATLLENGVNLLAALDIAREIVDNQVMARALVDVARRAREGAGLAGPLAEVQVFPPLAIQLIRLGERSGNLDSMLAQVADIYERDVQATLKRLLTLAEPAIIVFIALFISMIILSVVMMILESNNLAF